MNLSRPNQKKVHYTNQVWKCVSHTHGHWISDCWEFQKLNHLKSWVVWIWTCSIVCMCVVYQLHATIISQKMKVVKIPISAEHHSRDTITKGRFSLSNNRNPSSLTARCSKHSGWFELKNKNNKPRWNSYLISSWYSITDQQVAFFPNVHSMCLSVVVVHTRIFTIRCYKDFPWFVSCRY